MNNIIQNMAKKMKVKQYYLQYANDKKINVQKVGDRFNWLFIMVLLMWLIGSYWSKWGLITMLSGIVIITIGYGLLHHHLSQANVERLKHSVWTDMGETFLLRKLRTMDHQEFQSFCKELLAALPFYENIALEKQINGGEGFYLTGEFKGQPILVQCFLSDEDSFIKTHTIKYFKAKMTNKEIFRGLIITNSDFTQNSYQLTEQSDSSCKVILIDGKELMAMAKAGGFLMSDTACENYVEQQVAQRERHTLRHAAFTKKGSGACFVYGGLLLSCSLFLKPFFLYYSAAAILLVIGMFKLILNRKQKQQVQQKPIWEQD